VTQSTSLRALAETARTAARVVAKASAEQRRTALVGIADAIDADRAAILAANARDLAAATELSPAMPEAMIDRLKLDDKRTAALSRAVREIASAPDVLGEIVRDDVRPNGLHVQRVRIPLGVVLMIYEARPNVTTDAAALCLKAGNACILRGGREAIESNRALAAAVQRGLVAAGLPAEAVQLVPVTDREGIAQLVKRE
jgi:glutamate-5-semialdehyde dehydrogenase